MEVLSIDDLQVVGDVHNVRQALIYVIDSPRHPFDLTRIATPTYAALVRVPVSDWNDALTPWPAAGLYRGEPGFGGRAVQTLQELVEKAIPAMEQRCGLSPVARAICGYSLGGLFALYAFTHADAFDACGCLSGSVWYEGWVDHMRSLDIDLRGRFAFLSVGTKEKRAARPILRTVQDCMEQCVEILEGCGCVVRYRTSPGNHMQNVPERFEAGICALDGFLGGKTFAEASPGVDHADNAL